MEENAKINEQDVASLIFHKKIDNDMFSLESKDLKKWRRKQAVCREKINRSSKYKVPLKFRKQLQKEISDYLDAVCEVSFWEGKEYYKTGFYDCFSIFMQHIR